MNEFVSAQNFETMIFGAAVFMVLIIGLAAYKAWGTPPKE